MLDYEIKKLYEDMELYLIQSMKRNFKRHLLEEEAVGFAYPQWQSMKLKELKRYQRENKEIVGYSTKGFDKKVVRHLRDEFEEGSYNVMKDYKEEMGDKYKANKRLNNSFFKTNDKKVNSLIKSVNNDLTNANKAILRMTNDQYRQVIFKSEFYRANGVLTTKQAIDMANRDFLRRGLNVIEYKDGKRVNIASYSEMAIRTAGQRAMLMGEGEARQKLGTHLIRISTHGTSCELCHGWQGKILIDDVYGGGSKKDGNYTLLSEAMKQGLFHPNCKHGVTTYFDGADDISDINESYENGKDGSESDAQYQDDLNYINRKIKEYTRLEIGSLDEGNIKTYKDKRKEWESKKEELEAKAKIKGAKTIQLQKQEVEKDLYYAYSYKNNNQIKLYNVSYELPEGLEVGEKGSHLYGSKVKVKTKIKNSLKIETQKDIRNIITASNTEAQKIYDEIDKLNELIDKSTLEYADEHKLYEKKNNLLTNIREITDKYLKDNNYDSIHLMKEKKYILFNADNVRLSNDTYINLFSNDYDYKTFADELINNDYLTDDIAKSRGWLSKGEDLGTKKLLKDKGYDSKPSILSSKEFDNLSDDDYIKLYRGVVDNEAVTAKQINEQFVNGELYIGNGLFGNGTYTAENKFVGINYAQSKAENVLEMAISRKAKIVDVNELKDDLWVNDGKSVVTWGIRDYTKTLGLDKDKQELLSSLLKDETFVAVNKGYDVIKIEPEDWLKILHDKEQVIAEAQKVGEELKPYYLILNRGIVKVKGV